MTEQEHFQSVSESTRLLLASAQIDFSNKIFSSTAVSNMQRWWYSDNGQNGKDKIPKSKKSPSKRLDGLRKWKFQVVCQFQLKANEKIAVTGNCDELGKWDPDQAVFLCQGDGEFICCEI